MTKACRSTDRARDGEGAEAGWDGGNTVRGGERFTLTRDIAPFKPVEADTIRKGKESLLRKFWKTSQCSHFNNTCEKQPELSIRLCSAKGSCEPNYRDFASQYTISPINT